MADLALDSITVKGFKSIAELNELPLRPINVVIGPNGAGKSNFIGAFSFLRKVLDGQVFEYGLMAGGANKVLHFGVKTTPKMELGLKFQDGLKYEVSFGVVANDSLSVISEDVDIKIRGTAYLLGEAEISEKSAKGTAAEIRSRLSDWHVYHVHDTSPSSPLKLTAQIDDNHYLRGDGSNLAAFLYLLQERHQAAYDLIRRTIQRVAPFFDDFSLAPKKLNPKTIQLEWRHKGSDQYFDASSLSDGTLRFIALATLFLQPREYLPSLILVDEPELGLHPYAIEILGSLIKGAAARTQIIVGTQSSLLLDEFSPEDVLVAERHEGATHFRRLDSAQLKNWLEDYSLGQLWEKNEFGGRPTPES